MSKGHCVYLWQYLQLRHWRGLAIVNIDLELIAGGVLESEQHLENLSVIDNAGIPCSGLYIHEEGLGLVSCV